ncbi:hypothetical protein GGR51DRAFT_110287 [Nemania sp. FL0031]|nr:hypothetical protein GGR51DRAFT_110287 [Nemania sp. FL0031]
MECQIKIQNNTGDLNTAFRYIAFEFPPKSNGAPGGTGLPVVFYRSRLLNDGEPDKGFTLSSELYGYIGTASHTNRALTKNANVSLTKSLPVILGDRTGNGTELEAKPMASSTGIDFKEVTGGSQSASGTFSIIVNSTIRDNNQYVVGMARKLDNIEVVPVLAFGLNPGKIHTITPSSTIYIARDNNTNTETVVQPNDFVAKVQVELLWDQPRITVIDDGTRLNVRYR